MRRQQQTQLHANEEHHTKPNGVNAKRCHDRHEDGQRDHHHADLIHKDAQENDLEKKMLSRNTSKDSVDDENDADERDTRSLLASNA